MTQHDKFTQIIKQTTSGMLPLHIVEEIAPKIAESLIKEGAIILPCLLGEKVWVLGQLCGGCKNFNEPMKEEFIKECQNCKLREIGTCKFDYELIPEFGKTVFLTRKEAEAALSKMQELRKGDEEK